MQRTNQRFESIFYTKKTLTQNHMASLLQLYCRQMRIMISSGNQMKWHPCRITNEVLNSLLKAPLSLHRQTIISEFHRFIFGILDGPVGKLPRPLSWSHHERHDFIQDGLEYVVELRVSGQIVGIQKGRQDSSWCLGSHGLSRYLSDRHP